MSSPSFFIATLGSAECLKIATSPSSSPMYTLPSTISGEPHEAASISYAQFTLPVLALRQWNTPL